MYIQILDAGQLTSVGASVEIRLNPNMEKLELHPRIRIERQDEDRDLVLLMDENGGFQPDTELKNRLILAYGEDAVDIRDYNTTSPFTIEDAEGMSETKIVISMFNIVDPQIRGWEKAFVFIQK